MSSLWTEEHAAKLRAYLDRPGYIIPMGVGTEEEACSMAAIRLAWDGMLTDEAPPCMSRVLARWIIAVQDESPGTIRNSAEWRSLLPLAAGTGRERERERIAVIAEWVWGRVLPYMYPVADAGGYGYVWRVMCNTRTIEAATAAKSAAHAVTVHTRGTRPDIARSSSAAQNAAMLATRIVSEPDNRTRFLWVTVAAEATTAAYWVAKAVFRAATYTDEDNEDAAGAAWAGAWDAFDVPGTFRRIIEA